MTSSSESASGGPTQSSRLAVWPPLFALVAFLSYLLTPALPNAVLSADAQNFQDRMTAILDGKLPYFETLYEHLPLSLPPMMAARIVPGGHETFVYTAVFGVLMTACLIATGALIRRIAIAAEIESGASQWAVLTLPLVPIVAFRVDPVSLLLAVAAFYLSFVAIRDSALWVGLAGIAAKGWPVVLAPVEWWAGRRKRAIIMAVFAIVLSGGLLLTPGFQEGRDFSGVHLETMIGSLLAWIRSIAGRDSGLGMAAGAVYVAAPTLALLVGPALGGLLVWKTRALWKRAVTVRNAAQLMAVLTFALLLSSPLLSAQFLLWLTPWIVFFPSGAMRRLFVVQGLATTSLLAFWAPRDLLWQSVLLARNALLLLFAWELVRYVQKSAHPSQVAAVR